MAIFRLRLVIFWRGWDLGAVPLRAYLAGYLSDLYPPRDKLFSRFYHSIDRAGYGAWVVLADTQILPHGVHHIRWSLTPSGARHETYF